jgi:hypothetical protein
VPLRGQGFRGIDQGANYHNILLNIIESQSPCPLFQGGIPEKSFWSRINIYHLECYIFVHAFFFRKMLVTAKITFSILGLKFTD